MSEWFFRCTSINNCLSKSITKSEPLRPDSAKQGFNKLDLNLVWNVKINADLNVIIVFCRDNFRSIKVWRKREMWHEHYFGFSLFPHILSKIRLFPYQMNPILSKGYLICNQHNIRTANAICLLKLTCKFSNQFQVVLRSTITYYDLNWISFHYEGNTLETDLLLFRLNLKIHFTEVTNELLAKALLCYRFFSYLQKKISDPFRTKLKLLEIYFPFSISSDLIFKTLKKCSYELFFFLLPD